MIKEIYQNTLEMLNKENVSYGHGTSYSMPDGTKITFAESKLTDATRLYECNLKYC